MDEAVRVMISPPDLRSSCAAVLGRLHQLGTLVILFDSKRLQHVLVVETQLSLAESIRRDRRTINHVLGELHLA